MDWKFDVILILFVTIWWISVWRCSWWSRFLHLWCFSTSPPGESMRWSGTGAAGQQAGQGGPETSDGVRGAGASKGAARLNIQRELCSDLLTAPNSVVCAGTPGVVLWVQCQNWVQHWGGDDWARQVWWCFSPLEPIKCNATLIFEIYEWNHFILGFL